MTEDINKKFKHCERYHNTCTYPCKEFTTFRDNQFKAQESEKNKEALQRVRGLHRDVHTIHVDNLTNEKKQEIMSLIEQYSGEVCLDSFDDNVVINTMYEDSESETDIQNFLEYDVSDPLWLQVCNNQISYKELLDESALLSYFQECNEKFCEELSLCKYCRNPLVEADEDREHFGFDFNERVLVCGYGCE